jgi:hypothetical protein
MAKHRCQPFGAGLTVGVASPAQVVSHQQAVICPHQYLRQTLLQHVVEVHAIRRWWGIHAQVEDSGQFDFRRRDIRAASAAALQQVAASGFSDPSASAACKASAICKKRGPLFPANRGNQIGKRSSCMVFNWDILSQCMEIAFK